MDDFGGIDIEGKKLAVSVEDLAKLKSESGCSLQLINGQVHSLEDDDQNASGDDLLEDGEEEPFHRQDKMERMKREYLSLVLNANRDAIKPGPRSRLTKLLEYGEDLGRDHGDLFFAAGLDTKQSMVHTMYKDLGSFEERLANEKFAYKEISPDRVYKRTINVGVGPLVCESCMVIYNVALWSENSKDPFDSTWLRRTTIVSNLQTDSILPGLHELLMTTQKGEWCEALIRPEAAYGELGAMPRIPPNAMIFCLLEVVKVITHDKMSILAYSHNDSSGKTISFHDLYEACDEARKRGNHFFDSKQYKPALQRYKSGIRILDPLTYKDEQQEAKAMSLLLKLYNNCARTANALGNPRLALAACKQASLIDSNNPKTYWHRMAAWASKGHLDRALGVARRAMQLFPEPKTHEPFRRQAEELKKRILNEKVQLDDLHRLMARAIIA